MKTIREYVNVYRQETTTPTAVVNETLDAIDTDTSNAWVTVRDRETLLERARELESQAVSDNHLYGVPFAIKDNIDVAGLPTTAGCPAYAREPGETAPVVSRLTSEGAILIGKTNMDQFATGLVGTRSPYGACRNPRNEDYIAGGSSSGSAVAVAAEQVAFALGTDTAGSGRVPPALTGLVGLKPTRGAVSTRGVVPACRTLDCVALFCHTVEDIRQVSSVAIGYDSEDPYSRQSADDLALRPPQTEALTIGVPDRENLEFFGDREGKSLFEDVIDDIASGPWSVETIDFTPFVETANLLYEGPWVAERYAAVGEFIEEHPDEVNSVVADIIKGGAEYSATDTFGALYDLEAYKREVESAFDTIDVLVTPTIGTAYTIEEIQEQPVARNSNLGYYNNFANLLDLCAVTVPAGVFEAGPGFGVTIFSEAFEDALVAKVGQQVRQT